MMMGFGFLGMFLFWGVLLALLIGGAASVFRQTASVRSTSGQRQPTARQILDQLSDREEMRWDSGGASVSSLPSHRRG